MANRGRNAIGSTQSASSPLCLVPMARWHSSRRLPIGIITIENRRGFRLVQGHWTISIWHGKNNSSSKGNMSNKGKMSNSNMNSMNISKLWRCQWRDTHFELLSG
jgi:hypothetical protein